MLKGLITCAHCARPLTASESRGKHGDRHAYYHCQPRTNGPRCHRVRRDALDTAFLDALDACTVDDEALRRRCAQLERFIAQQAAEQAAERKQLEARKGKIDADRMRLVGHLQTGTLAPDISAKADAKYRDLGQIERGPRLLDAQTIPDVSQLLAFGRSVLSNLKASYLQAKPSHRAELLRALFEKVTIEDGEVRTTRGAIFSNS